MSNNKDTNEEILFITIYTIKEIFEIVASIDYLFQIEIIIESIIILYLL